jgi:transporter family-2 protein
MAAMIALAFAAGLLVSLSRALNGRLALATSPLKASWWNHAIGFGFLLAAALAAGQIWPAGVAATPPWAWAGGTLGVIFVASGSWLILRIGAALTALMVIAGQMVSGAALDALTGAPGSLATGLGVVLILAGMGLARTRR